MNTATTAPYLPRPHVRGLTAVKTVAIAMTPLILALATLGGVGSYATVRHAAQPYFGGLAWIVPIGMDIGVLILLAWDLLLEYVELGWPVLRWIAWAYIAGTVTVNISAAHGDVAGIVMHAAMPVLFIATMEGVRHLIRQWAGLESGTRMERIPVSRWVLAPYSTVLLWRRMVLWHVTGYRDGLRLEHQHLEAVSHLQNTYGRWAWRWRAPLRDRLALRLHGVHMLTPIVAAPAICGPCEQQPASAESHQAMPEWAGAALLEAAERILAEAERRGVRISKAMLGARLRQQGFSIANGRLADLAALVADAPSRSRVQQGRQLPRSDDDRGGR